MQIDFKTMTTRKSLYLALAIALCASGLAKAQVTLSKETVLTDNALHFTDGRFSNRISPHGDCMDILNDYIFVTWYAGPKTDRRVHISRKKIGENNWVDMTLNDSKNTLWRDGTGDSHNTTNIGICPIDGTIHIAYDHHANPLRYRVSVKGAAFVPDSEWKASLMKPEQDYLTVPTEDIDHCTYPTFIRNDAGQLILTYRRGGSTNGRWPTSFYDGDKWSGLKVMTDGLRTPNDLSFNAYSAYYNFNGKIRFFGSVRIREDDNRNKGLYYAILDSQDGSGDNFITHTGESRRLPLNTRDKIEGINIIGRDVTVRGRSITVTPDDTVYVSADGRIWTCGPGEATFSRRGGSQGELLSVNDKVFTFETVGSSGQVQERLERVTSGRDDWQEVYRGPKRSINGNYTVRAYKNKIIAVIQRDGGQQRRIDCLEYDTGEPDESTLSLAPSYGNGGIPGSGNPWLITASRPARIEAENFDQGANGVSYSDSTPENLGQGAYRLESEADIQDSADLGGGSEIAFTTAGEWLQYSVNVASRGFYDLTFRYSKGSAGVSSIQVLSDGTELANNIPFPNTTGWSSYREVTQRITLESGPQVLRVRFIDGSMNLNHLTFASVPPEEITMAVVGPLAVSSVGATWSDGRPAHSGAIYIVPDRGQLRSDTGNSVFPGFALRVDPGGRFQPRSNGGNGEVTTVEELILVGGDPANGGLPAGLQAGTGSNVTNVISGNITTSGHARFLTFDRANNDRIARSLRVDSRISGDGRIEAWEGLNGQEGEVVTITNPANSFSGVWEVGAGSTLRFTNGSAIGSAAIVVTAGTLEIDGNWVSENSLVATDGPDVSVSLSAHHWSMRALTIGRSAIPDGVYRAADLNARLRNPIFAGSGSITVGAVAPGGPIAHWRLDEGRGTVAGDATGSGYIGTLLHGAQWASDETRGSFVSFDGEDDRISTLFTYALASSDDFTWSWWANQRSSGSEDSNALMVGNRYGGSGSETLEFIKFTTTQAELRNGAGVSYNYGDIEPGDWHHYAMVKSGTSYQWYVDGEAAGAAMTLNYSESDPLPFNIGGDDNNATAGGQENEHFRGFIDEVILYDRALGVDEIEAVIASTNGTSAVSPIEDWRLTYFNVQASEGDAEDSYDANFDGESNLLEFATGQDPFAATRLATPIEFDGGHLKFTYSRSHAALDEEMVFQVLWSETLAANSWSAASVSEVIADDDGIVQTVVATLPEASDGKLFVRLSVE